MLTVSSADNHPPILWSFCQEIQNPVVGGSWDCHLPDQLAQADGTEGRTVVQEEHVDIRSGVTRCGVELLLPCRPLISWGGRQTGGCPGPGGLRVKEVIFSRHIMATGVSATGLKSFRLDVSSLLYGTTAWDSDRLEYSGRQPIGSHHLVGVHLLQNFQYLCVCHLKVCPWGRRGLLRVCLCFVCRTWHRSF